jgi:hypothetical protein
VSGVTNCEGRKMTKRPPGGRHLGLMRVGVALVVFLQCLSPAIAYAAAVSVTPTSLSVLSTSTQYSDVDATGYETLTLSFQYNAEKLDAGDDLLYGWKTDSSQIQLGLVEGKNEPGLVGDETGAVESLELPAVLANTEFQLYFQNTGTASGTNDQVDISEISIDGDVIILDTTPPAAPAALPPAGSYNTTQSVTLNSSDDSGLTPVIHYTTDGSTPDQTSQLYMDAISVSTSLTIKAIAYDATGNESEIASFAYVIDTVAPTIQNVQYSNNGTPTKDKVTVTITTSEPVDTPDGWTKVDDMTFTKEYSANTTETVSVRDAAGNVSEVSTIDVRGIDVDPPAILINGANNTGAYNSAVTYTTSDNVAVSVVTINGIAASPSGSITSSGNYIVTVTDTAGNEATVSFSVAIPIVMPTLSVSPPKALETLSSRNLVSTPNLGVAGVTPSATNPETSRVDIAQAGNPDLKKPSTQKDVALAPSGEGWKLWGIAWYWYGAVASLLGSGGWLLGRRYFASDNEEL